jgi:peptidoglycan/xylan/chitin deacetylase (PgdA/CDA1 family)
MANAWIKKSMVNTGVLRLLSRFTRRGVAIIMYHSVMDEPASAEATLGGIVHSTDVFRGQMEVIARGFHAVKMDEVLDILQGKKELPARTVALTFDDGYADNFLAANDILTPLGIPAAFYVTVDCIDRQRPPWPSRVRHAFLTSKKQSWREINGGVWPLSSNQQRIRAFERASEYCSKVSGAAQEQLVSSLEQQLEAEALTESRRLMMTWEEVRSLSRSGHTVGSHTMTHPNLAQLSEGDARTELCDAKRKLEQELSASVVHFSYPCPALEPHWNEQTVKASREAGYRTAVTTNGGLVRRDDDSLSLRRIRPTKTVEGFRWNLECTFLGRKV